MDIKVGLIGYPVTHSFSPMMHNAAFEKVSLDWRYVPLSVHPVAVGETIRSLYKLNFRGANVTIPHKLAVMEYLDEISPDAQAIGAVNTIVVEKDGFLRGYNTDWQGFLRTLAENEFEPRGKRALILGAGGAARAVIYGLVHAGAAEVTILNRTVERAEKLAEDIGAILPHGNIRAAELSAERIDAAQSDANLLVNATPLGMHPNVDASPYPDELRYPAHLTVCDLVYNPRETKLMAKARAAGAKVIGGLGMLVHQGATAFELWTGHAAPVGVMYQMADKAARRKKDL